MVLSVPSVNMSCMIWAAAPASEAIDHAVWYNVDVLLTNGSTISTSAIIFQTASGETFLTEFSSSLDNLEIQSITPTRCS